MSLVAINITGKKGVFEITEGTKRLAEMEVGIKDGILTVYHTEVSPEAEGKGLAKVLLESMVEYARANSLKVVPLCVFVLGQFKRHPETYADLWQG